MQKDKKYPSVENTYGGVRYRFSYDDSLRAAEVRQLRRQKRGARSFWITFGMVGLFCACVAATATIYRNFHYAVGSKVEHSSPEAGVVSANAVVRGENYKVYNGYFSVSDMTQRAVTVYHIPAGLMINEVFESTIEANKGLLMDGDIIVSVDGEPTLSIDSFDGLFGNKEKRIVNFTIFREGEHLNVEYLLNDEE